MRTKRLLGTVLTAVLLISNLPFLNATQVNAATAGITLSGTCHVQDYGDTNGVWDASTGILTLGTRGQSKRVEAITINLTNDTGYSGSLQYRVHVQDIGWQEYRNAGEMAGTSGQAKRLEGIEMNLTDDLATYYTVEYAVHIQDYGDAQGFVSDGALAGTTGESKRLEEVQVRIVPRWQGTSTSVNYRVHRQDYGWESTWAKDGAESGTTGQSKRLEGIEIHLTGNQYSGGIEYRTHVQNIGWEQVWSKNGEMSGTQGLSYRLEGIEIKLTGQISNYYDVYYRVHAQDYGWLGWAKNGEMSGTSGMSKRLEAIQIVLVAKGGAAPGDVEGITSVMPQPSVVDGTPTSPSGSQPTTPATPSPVLNDNNEKVFTHEVLATVDGISFATAQLEIPRYKQIYNEQEIGLCGNSEYSYTYACFGFFVTDEFDSKDIYIKLNGDEGFRDIGNAYTQYIPNYYAPVATTYCSYYNCKDYWFRYDDEINDYMLDNGFSGTFYIEIECALSGEQSFEVYYKDTKITTLTFDCTNESGTIRMPDSVSQMYGDISKYEDNMTDYELISAGCYWIRNHSYRDYTCWGCQVVRSMMLMKGYPSVILSCSQYVDGKIINDYSNYYAVCYKNRNDCSAGHRVCLIFVSPTEYMFIEVQGSSGLAKGETSFKQPWERIIPVSKSIYDKVSWLRDYDTVYDMVLGDYGIDLATYDPYDCSTWC